ELWERSLRNLDEAIRGTLSGPTAPAAGDDTQTRAHVRELVAHLRREFAALIASHGQTPRRRPDPPAMWQNAQERQEWHKRVDEHLAREPLYGPYFTRMWRDELRALDTLESSLK